MGGATKGWRENRKRKRGGPAVSNFRLSRWRQRQKRIAKIGVGAFAAVQFTPGEVLPRGKVGVTGHVSVDEREVQSQGVRLDQPEGLLVKARAAADVDLSR